MVTSKRCRRSGLKVSANESRQDSHGWRSGKLKNTATGRQAVRQHHLSEKSDSENAHLTQTQTHSDSCSARPRESHRFARMPCSQATPAPSKQHSSQWPERPSPALRTSAASTRAKSFIRKSEAEGVEHRSPNSEALRRSFQSSGVGSAGGDIACTAFDTGLGTLCTAAFSLCGERTSSWSRSSWAASRPSTGFDCGVRFSRSAQQRAS